MSFGYIGDTSTSVKQQVKNKGILTTQESFDLERQGFLGGSLELIEEQTVSDTTASVEFTSIKENVFDVHVLQLSNVQLGTQENVKLQFSTDSGSSYISTGYQHALQRQQANSSFQQDKDSSASSIRIVNTAGATTNDTINLCCYLYNLGNSSKDSFVSLHNVYIISNTLVSAFGGGVLATANLVNAIKIFLTSGDNYDNGVFKLFGVKEIS
tara:strand:- start:1694 stop:2329 length:636 start_codon:yes stop_codon:yes gene_type:complete